VSGGKVFGGKVEQKFNIEHMPAHVMLKVGNFATYNFLRLEWMHQCGPSFSHSPVLLPAKPNIPISPEIK
jgi:hypothetical protein